MAVARGSRLGRTLSAGSATRIGISGPSPCRNASASASPANAPPPMTMLPCAMLRLTLLRRDYSWAKQVHQTSATTPTTVLILSSALARRLDGWATWGYPSRCAEDGAPQDEDCV